MKQYKRVIFEILIALLCSIGLVHAQDQSSGTNSTTDSNNTSSDSSTSSNTGSSTDLGTSSFSDLSDDSNSLVKNYIKGAVIGSLIFIAMALLCWILTKETCK